jgi:CheY-like chemotaxis protein
MLSGRKILVVDDELDTLEIQCLILRLAGATVECVSSVSQALAAIAALQPDLIVTDLAMPERDGFELLRAIRTLPADNGRDTPVVVVSGHAHDLGERAAREGATRVLAKPVDPHELTALAASLT